MSLPMMAEFVRIAKTDNLVTPGPRHKQIGWQSNYLRQGHAERNQFGRWYESVTSRWC